MIHQLKIVQISAMYVMTDGDHIYTLDHDVNHLSQNLDDEFNQKKPTIPINHDYYLNDKKEPAKYIMIDNFR
jgi:hypothetical protein